MAAAALPLAAQTTPPASTAHKSTAATATHRAAAPGCVTTPELSPKIPALPASAPCVKVLYTVTRTPTMKLDYASPLVSAAVRDELSGGSATYSLDYVDTQVGTGEVAKAGKWLTVHYTGYLVDGTKFDSSHDRGQPISFPYGTHQVIPGWDTGFEGMHLGGKRRLFIPYELGYGDTGKGPIPAKAELIFDVEFISQSDTRPAAPPPAVRPGAPGMSARPPGSGVHPPAGTATPPPSTTTPPQVTTPPPGTTTPPQGTTPPPGTTTPQAGSTPPAGASTPPPASTSTPQSGNSSDSKPQR
jgi:peptidylprolyl isomerase